EADRKRFNDMSTADKEKVNEQIKSTNANDPITISRIWESSVNNKVVSNDPLWLQAASEKYKKLYNESPEHIKESIKARAQFFNLSTNYQIENFWETSGLNESIKMTGISNQVIASNINPTMITESISDEFVGDVAKAMKRYSN
ncbi:MAG: hypothetical protein RSD40_01585, partial [Bacilli bacterium]